MTLLFAAADLIDRVVEDFDGMELVEGDSGIGQVFGNPLDEGRAHVDADLFESFRIAAIARRGQRRRRQGPAFGHAWRAPTECEGLGTLALGGEQHPRLVDIGEQRDVVVTVPGGGLVDGDPGHICGVDARPRLIDVVGNAVESRLRTYPVGSTGQMT